MEKSKTPSTSMWDEIPKSKTEITQAERDSHNRILALREAGTLFTKPAVEFDQSPAPQAPIQTQTIPELSAS